jgi:hypothetical protein
MVIWKVKFIKKRKADTERRNYGVPGDHAFGVLYSGYRNLLVLVEFVIPCPIMATVFILFMILFAATPFFIQTAGVNFLSITTFRTEEEICFYEFIMAKVAVYPKASGAEEHRKSNGYMGKSF